MNYISSHKGIFANNFNRFLLYLLSKELENNDFKKNRIKL